MKKLSHGIAGPTGENPTVAKAPEIDAIKAKGEYNLRLTLLCIVVILATGGIMFSLCYPAGLAAIWSVITPIILTILMLAMKAGGRGGRASK